ncbi:uncharacterized protein BDR25DRAFT_282909 [Lindgomyces ingoldianus]|uniref:Uncharacterized protein n=1 Tax=Lindgomyces ingoldianus TaxID=673940 RepID=A0ACB6R2C2_9PLEO|nr:uncharacterized protein BDR25DRAFT_282909 [Lindgomyces ingoldianus]KAF2473394.1 hypothetical protein BDR25DRAFT_282909 [Lindgomyces ingoldianus]
MGAIEFLCDIRFHRTLILPPNPETGRPKYRLSYADFGDSNSDAVVLFCGALMGMRLCYSPLDQLAKAHGVRIIHPDRPGIGGSDPVEQSERIPMWLEMIPHLLSHLKISHVSITSHSGGMIYALNTMLTYPHLLHPTNPYVTFFAPWVHPSHSGVTHMRAAELLPAPLIGRFMSVARFVNKNVMPLAGLSSSFLHGIKDSFLRSNSTPAPIPLDPSSLSPTASRTSSQSPAELNFDSPAVVEELRQLIISYLFAESTDGISADAKLFLKRPSSTTWCSPSVFWSDVDYAVALLSKIIEEEKGASNNPRKWIIESFHGETDDMVGEKGRTWFDSCWTPSGSSSSNLSGARTGSARNENSTGFEYRSEVVPGSEHNYLMDPAYGASEGWLRRVREAFLMLEEV